MEQSAQQRNKEWTGSLTYIIKTGKIHKAIIEFDKAWESLAHVLEEEALDDHKEAINMIGKPDLQWVKHCIIETYINEFSNWKNSSLENLENLVNLKNDSGIKPLKH